MEREITELSEEIISNKDKPDFVVEKSATLSDLLAEYDYQTRNK